MAIFARIDEIKKKFDENPRRYFAPLANEFRKAGDLEQAILICEEFLPQQAGHMSGHIVYGQALFESGRLPESRTVFETALGLDPENLIALRHLGDIARAQGEPVEARRWYDRVLEADPRNEEIQGVIASLDAGSPPPTAGSGPAPAELTAIDLDVDESAFASPAAPDHLPHGASSVISTASAPAPDAPVESLALDSLVPATAAPAAPIAPVSPPSGRAEGLEPAEFEVPTTAHARAEGLEPAEFERPTGQPARAEGLETTEFSAPAADSTDRSLLDLEGSFHLPASTGSAGVAPLPGLDARRTSQPVGADEPSLPSLDLEEGLAVPAHDATPSGSRGTPAADVPLGEAAGRGAEDPRMEPPAAMEAMPALAAADPSAESWSAPMMELPPAVIAAESALMDADASDESSSEARSAGDAASRPAPFVTETMAELYLSQGFHAQALAVFRQLSAASPADARLRERVAVLERGEYDAAPQADAGPTVREFLFRLAIRRPGEGAAATLPPAEADFASFDAIPETPTHVAAADASPAPHPWDLPPRAHEAVEDAAVDARPLPFMDTGAAGGAHAAPAPAAAVPEAAPAREAAFAPMPSPSERATAAQGGAGTGSPGTIDALFGTRAPATSEDSAASALAQAFGGTPETPVITGRPARAASAELSLDSVFRDGPPRPPRASQSFSFDQFFSESAADSAGKGQPAGGEGAAAGEPAERSADDVKQFNSWLQGLKPQ